MSTGTRELTTPRLVSVVIPAHNAAGTLGQQLEALTLQTYRGAWEVVISDNGSTDGTDTVARSYADRLPNLRVVDSSGRKGEAHARNVGAQAAGGDFIACCDADDEVDPAWLAALVEVGASFDIVGGAYDRGALNDSTTQAWRVFRMSGDLPTHRFLPYAFGGNAGVWADVVERVGGWNDEYVYGGTDVEFAWRAQLRGCSLGLAPEARVKTRFRESMDDLVRQAYLRGMAQAHIYRDFRDQGLTHRGPRAALRQIGWIVLHVADYRSPQKRGAWLWVASMRWGKIRGCIRYRVLCW
jgi:glycosyltransferase involved in cell wall biosynthesis